MPSRKSYKIDIVDSGHYAGNAASKAFTLTAPANSTIVTLADQASGNSVALSCTVTGLSPSLVYGSTSTMNGYCWATAVADAGTYTVTVTPSPSGYFFGCSAFVLAGCRGHYQSWTATSGNTNTLTFTGLTIPAGGIALIHAPIQASTTASVTAGWSSNSQQATESHMSAWKSNLDYEAQSSGDVTVTWGATNWTLLSGAIFTP